MNDTMKKYLSTASSFMYDDMISESKKEDGEAVIVTTEGKNSDEFKGNGKIAKLGTKGLPKKPILKEEGEDGDFDASDVKLGTKNIARKSDTVDEDELTEEDVDTLEEDEDDGSEDGEICEEDEIEDEEAVEDLKKKKMDIKESYIAHASRWM